MNKLAELINGLPAQDIALIKKDLDEGNLSNVLKERMAELEMPQKICPICNADVAEDAPFVLYFGKHIRQKARFDAVDCLQFFIKKLK